MDRTEGYLLRAIGNDLYFDLTICLAASIRLQMDARPILIFTDNPKHPLLEEYSYMFDGIIDITPYKQELVDRYGLTTPAEVGGILPRLLTHLSPYNRTIMLDSDIMMIKDTAPLWNISQNYNFTMIGCDTVYPGWGEMADCDIQHTSKIIAKDVGQSFPVHLREVHAGITWLDKSETTAKVMSLFKESLLENRHQRYFPKVFKMWYGKNDEMATMYAMSLLDLPVIPYNRNLLSLNPDYFSVEDGVADMGDLYQGRVQHLNGKMSFVDTCPVAAHFFRKANDSNFWRNKKFLYEWVNIMMPGANLNFLG